MKPGSKIIVNAGGTFNAYLCNFVDCENYLWYGIELNGGNLKLNKCYLRDALYAVKTKGTGTAIIYNTLFRANCYGIYMENNTNSVSISKCRFVGAVTKQAYIGMVKPSYNGVTFTKSYCGIYAQNKNWTINNFVIIGGSPSFPAPFPSISTSITSFDSLNNGIVYKNCNVTLQRCKYTYILPDASNFGPDAGKGVYGESTNTQIYSFTDHGIPPFMGGTHNYLLDGYYFKNISNLKIYNQTFGNTIRGIYSEGGLNLDLYANNFHAYNALTLNYQLGVVKVHHNTFDNLINYNYFLAGNLINQSQPQLIPSGFVFKDFYSTANYSAHTTFYNNNLSLNYPSQATSGGYFGIVGYSLNTGSSLVLTNNDISLNGTIPNGSLGLKGIHIQFTSSVSIRQNTIYGDASNPATSKNGISIGSGCTYDSINCNHLNNTEYAIHNGGYNLFTQVYYSGNHFEGGTYGIYFHNTSYSTTAGAGLYEVEPQIRRDNTWNNTPGAFTQAAAYFYNSPGAATASAYITGIFDCNPNSSAPTGTVFYPTTLGINQVVPNTGWFNPLPNYQNEFQCSNGNPGNPIFSTLQYKIARNEIETEVYNAQFRYNNLSLLYQILDTITVIDSTMQALKDSLENTNIDFVNTITKAIRMVHTYSEEEQLNIMENDSILQSLLTLKSNLVQQYFDALNLPVYDTLLSEDVNDSIMNTALCNNLPDSILMLTWQTIADSLDTLIAIQQIIIENLTYGIWSNHQQYVTWANNMLEIFIPENVMEENFKEVSIIWLNTIGQLDNNFTSNQISKLNTIAWQCPVSGGLAVQTARDLLTLKFPYFEYPDSLICDSLGIAMREQSDSKNEKQNFANLDAQVYVYPNPVIDNLTIENYSTNKLNCLIYTMDGIEVCNETIANNETAHLINLEHLPSGVYQLKLTNSTKQILIKKLVKI